MNKVIINGHLVKDMDVKDRGKCLVGNFTIANNVGFGENQKTNFGNCVMFGDSVESLVESLVTGCQVLAEGAFALEQYDKDGENGYATKVYIKGLEIEKFKEEKKVNKYTKKGAKK